MEILFNIVISIIFFGVSIANIYFAIKYAANKSRKDNMSKIDFSKSKEYYREILKEYSPAELSYIDDFKINPMRECVSTILNLKLKNRVEIGKDGIVVIDNNEENLKRTEKFILNSIDGGKVKISNSGYIETFAQKEAIEDELITKNTEAKNQIKNIIIRTILIFVLSFILFAVFCNNIERFNEINNGVTVGIILAIVIAVFIIINLIFQLAPIVIIIYSLMQINSYKRTEKGEEINKNIEGLKKYIKDYSLLNDKEEKELTIWEEYLIYSVIFNLNNTDIVQKISAFIEFEYEIGKIYISKV
jgi:heme/copper-type cytochrome/quinol oxidase subunit 2